ncbi:MAG: hypothetical protein WKG07_11130 [Hymenobacter sp.]
MGENIDRSYKPDSQWNSDYTTAWNAATAGGAGVADAATACDGAADAGRLQPGTDGLQPAPRPSCRTSTTGTWAPPCACGPAWPHAEAQVNAGRGPAARG